MPSLQFIPLFIGILVGVLLSFVGWSIARTRSNVFSDPTSDAQHQVLFWFVLVAVFVAGAFVTFVLLKL
jgi:divalent metal cation (Fe/Co/Zn/Cd) transporter